MTKLENYENPPKSWNYVNVADPTARCKSAAISCNQLQCHSCNQCVVPTKMGSLLQQILENYYANLLFINYVFVRFAEKIIKIILFIFDKCLDKVYTLSVILLLLFWFFPVVFFCKKSVLALIWICPFFWTTL